MDLGWTWVRSASSFAGVAGILAAFTISAIVLVLSVASPAHRDSEHWARSSQHLFYAYLVALYSLIASALLFTDITGETNQYTARSFFTGMFAGTIMALAVVQLLLAIIWSGTEYNPRLSLRGAVALYIAIVVLASIMVLIDQGDFFTATSNAGVYWFVAYPYLAWIGPLSLFTLPLSLGFISRWIARRRRDSIYEKVRDAAYRYHDIALTLSACVTTLLTGIVSVLREQDSVSLVKIFTPLASIAVMALFGICIFFFTLSLPYQVPRK